MVSQTNSPQEAKIMSTRIATVIVTLVAACGIATAAMVPTDAHLPARPHVHPNVPALPR